MATDFDAMIEDESWLQDSPPRLTESVSKSLNSKRRSRACNIDELLKDHYRDKSKRLDREAKRYKACIPDSEDSDSDDNEFPLKTNKERQFEKLVETCEKQVSFDGATSEVVRWGERLFSGQRRKETSVGLRMDSCVLQSLLTSQRLCTYNTAESEQGSWEDEQSAAESLLAELLSSGWFLAFKFKLDNDIMGWIFHKMVYTSDKTLETAACDLLCHTLEMDSACCSWIPSYNSILGIFEAYGYARPQVSVKGSLDSEELPPPPTNLGSLLQLLIKLMKTRHVHRLYSTEDVEESAVLIASLLLDRSLVCFGVLIQECLVSILNAFTEDEWHVSCERIATSMVKVDRHAVNCLKLTRALHNRDDWMKSLQSLIALKFFAKISNDKAITGVWEMLSVFRRTDVKRTVVDFGSLYYQMCMADIWLWSNQVLESDKAALGAWLLFLKSCSFQISSTDWRPYATKMRNHASYLLQVYQSYYQGDDYEKT